MTYGNNIDLSGYEIQNGVVQNLSAAPSSPVVGRFYFDTTIGKFGIFNGTIWEYYATANVTKAANATAPNVLQISGGADKSLIDFISAGGIIKVSSTGVASIAVAGTDYLTASSTNTLTNKSFDAAGTGNALTNVATSMFAVGAIDTDTTMAANSDTRLSTQKATKAYIDNKVSSGVNVVGVLDASANPNYPTAAKGDLYKISIAGKIGGASGQAVTAGDSILCIAATGSGTEASVGANWDVIQANVDLATYVTQGLVTFATLTETEAKSSTSKAVVPADLVNFVIKRSFTLGDGVATSFVLTHNLNTTSVSVTLRYVSSGAELITDNAATTANTVTITFGKPPAANSISVKIDG